MKPTLVADEMFPEGANFMELDEVKLELVLSVISVIIFDFNSQPGSGSGLLMDLAANEKDVHADFFNGKLSVKCFFLDCGSLNLLLRFQSKSITLIVFWNVTRLQLYMYSHYIDVDYCYNSMYLNVNLLLFKGILYLFRTLQFKIDFVIHLHRFNEKLRTFV